MPRRKPPRRGYQQIGLTKLAAEANKAAEAAQAQLVNDKPRPIPTVGFGHDPSIGSRQRKAAKARAKTAKQPPRKTSQTS